jgi:hypothetical protein
VGENRNEPNKAALVNFRRLDGRDLMASKALRDEVEAG